jgi:hypothetical protein
MKKPFTISWSKPKVVLSLPKYQEIASGDTLQRLTSYSESVLNTLRKNHLPSADYGEAEIKILSDGINATRLQYNADSRETIANLYGLVHPSFGAMQPYKTDGSNVKKVREYFYLRHQVRDSIWPSPSPEYSSRLTTARTIPSTADMREFCHAETQSAERRRRPVPGDGLGARCYFRRARAQTGPAGGCGLA